MLKRKFYSEYEVNFIKENYLILNSSEIAKVLDRNPQSINTKKHKLGLRLKKLNNTNLCLFCSSIIKNKKNNNILYCSERCNKRTSFIKQNPDKKPHYFDKLSFYKSDTGKGRYWEEFVADKLEATLMPFSHAYDVEYKGVTIDVKSATEYIRKDKSHNQNAGVYTFHKTETNGISKLTNFLLCIAFKIEDDNFILQNAWLIPYDLIKNDMTVSQNSVKYKEFEIDFNNIENIKARLTNTTMFKNEVRLSKPKTKKYYPNLFVTLDKQKNKYQFRKDTKGTIVQKYFGSKQKALKFRNKWVAINMPEISLRINPL